MNPSLKEITRLRKYMSHLLKRQRFGMRLARMFGCLHPKIFASRLIQHTLKRRELFQPNARPNRSLGQNPARHKQLQGLNNLR